MIIESLLQPVNSFQSSSGQSAMVEGRPHLLHRCAISLDSIAHKAYRRIEELDSYYVASLARLLAFMARPFLRLAEQLCLSWLSFIDRLILAAEKVLAFIFPRLEPVFLKIDELAPLADALPDQFDRAIDHLASLLGTQELSAAVKSIVAAVMANVTAGASHGEQPETDAPAKEGGYELRAKEEDDMREMEKNCKEIFGALEKMGMADTKDAGKGAAVGREDDGEKKKAGGGEPVLQEQISEVKVKDPINELFDQGWHL